MSCCFFASKSGVKCFLKAPGIMDAEGAIKKVFLWPGLSVLMIFKSQPAIFLIADCNKMAAFSSASAGFADKAMEN